MQPRFIIKTHTEALRPGNYSILISKCTFPDKSSYPENIEKKLSEFLKKSVAKHTVLTATKKNRGFGFLLDNMIWSWKGHVINTVLRYMNKNSQRKEVFYELSNMEKIAFLRFYLETEGAIIFKLTEKIAKMNEITLNCLKGEIQNIFNEIYEGYFDLTDNFRSRIKIKEMIKEMQKRRYAPGTLIHKIKPHIQALSDLGVLTVRKRNSEEIYGSAIFGNVRTCTMLHNQLVDFQTMEGIFRENNYFQLIARIFNLNPVSYSSYESRERLKETMMWGYGVMSDKTTGMADLDALYDWCCIKLLSEDNIIVNRKNIDEFLNEIKLADPNRVRYHLDGKGNIAYIILQLNEV